MSRDGYAASGLGLLAIIVVVVLAMYPVIPPLIGWPIVTALGVAAIVLFVRGANLKQEKPVLMRDAPAIALRPKSHLSWRDRATLSNIETKMQELHGHNDRRVMEAEMLRGVSASDLIRMKCTICFKPRDQQGENEI